MTKSDNVSKESENNEIFDLSIVDEIHAYSSGCVVALMLALDIDINYAMNSLHLNILEEMNNCLFGSAFNFLKILRKHLNIFLDSLSDDILKKQTISYLFIYHILRIGGCRQK